MIMPQEPHKLVVEPLPAFTDNYLWLIHDQHKAAVIDPGDAAVVAAALRTRHLDLHAILITHHHPDHIGGVGALKAATGARVYGPAAEIRAIPDIDQALCDGDHFELATLPLHLEVIAVPGHTLGHIAYHDPAHAWLFCGDTLFSGGCGRLFEGTPEQMHASLQRLAALPDTTQVYCAHEYTLANLNFAQAVEPDNPAVAQAIADTRQRRKIGQPTVPSTIQREKRINPFLRCGEAGLATALRARGHATAPAPVSVFTALRGWKDDFRG